MPRSMLGIRAIIVADSAVVDAEARQLGDEGMFLRSVVRAEPQQELLVDVGATRRQPRNSHLHTSGRWPPSASDYRAYDLSFPRCR